MPTKRNVLKSELPLIIVAATVVLLTIVWLVYRTLGRSKCDNIFEQTSDQLGANLKIIKIKGELALGQKRVQELTEASQKLGLHLKSCCVAQQTGKLTADQFQACISGAKDSQTQIIQVVTNLIEANAAQEQQKPELAKEKTDAAQEGASKIVNTEKKLAKTTEAFQNTEKTPAKMTEFRPASTSVKSGAEQEPNNTIPQANSAEFGTITGEINPGDDVDFFKFQYNDAKKRRDIVAVHLENPSTTLRPSLVLYNEDRSIARNWDSANAPGANLEFSFSTEPDKTYFLGVGSYSNGTAGAYAISVLPKKDYDQYEPNDDVFTATPLKVGQTIEAKIMDGTDVDSYRVSGVKEKSFTVHLENLSPTLRPSIRVLKSDKSIARNSDAPNAPAADLTFSVESDPGQDYFIEVSSYSGGSAGRYKLTVR